MQVMQLLIWFNDWMSRLDKRSSKTTTDSSGFFLSFKNFIWSLGLPLKNSNMPWFLYFISPDVRWAICRLEVGYKNPCLIQLVEHTDWSTSWILQTSDIIMRRSKNYLSRILGRTGSISTLNPGLIFCSSKILFFELPSSVSRIIVWHGYRIGIHN